MRWAPLLILVLLIPEAVASPMPGFVVNDDKKLCGITTIADEYGAFEFKYCRVLVNKDVYDWTAKPREFCEAMGYEFEQNTTSFCDGGATFDYKSMAVIAIIALLVAIFVLFAFLKHRRN